MKPQRKRTLQEQQEIEKKFEQAGWMRINLTPCARREETQPDEEEGKPKVPLPDEAEPVPPSEEMPIDEDPWEEEEQAAREEQKAHIYGFLTGMVTAWIVIGLGVLALLVGRVVAKRLASLLDIPLGVLIGLCLLFGLAMLLRRKMGKLAAKLVDLIDPDF